jgi:hypothetical protein
MVGPIDKAKDFARHHMRVDIGQRLDTGKTLADTPHLQGRAGNQIRRTACAA